MSVPEFRDWFRVPPFHCWHCDHSMDAITVVGQPNDKPLVALCLYCGHWNMITKNAGRFTTRQLTQLESMELLEEPGYLEALKLGGWL